MLYSEWDGIAGNLPANTKCSVCRKSCASSECLAGMRCQWCQRAAHAGCHKSVQPPEFRIDTLRQRRVRLTVGRLKIDDRYRRAWRCVYRFDFIVDFFELGDVARGEGRQTGAVPGLRLQASATA